MNNKRHSDLTDRQAAKKIIQGTIAMGAVTGGAMLTNHAAFAAINPQQTSTLDTENNAVANKEIVNLTSANNNSASKSAMLSTSVSTSVSTSTSTSVSDSTSTSASTSTALVDSNNINKYNIRKRSIAANETTMVQNIPATEASISDARFSLTVTPKNNQNTVYPIGMYNQGIAPSSTDLSVTFNINDGSKAGEVISLKLSPNFNLHGRALVPNQINIINTSGDVIATGVYSSADKIYNFTLTPYVNDHRNIVATINIPVYVDSIQVPNNGPQTLIANINGKTFADNLNVEYPPIPYGTNGYAVYSQINNIDLLKGHYEQVIYVNPNANNAMNGVLIGGVPQSISISGIKNDIASSAIVNPNSTQIKVIEVDPGVQLPLSINAQDWNTYGSDVTNNMNITFPNSGSYKIQFPRFDQNSYIVQVNGTFNPNSPDDLVLRNYAKPSVYSDNPGAFWDNDNPRTQGYALFDASSISVSTSVSESMSTSTSESESTSTSKSESTSISKSKSESTSTSKSDSESTSISKSESTSISKSESDSTSTSKSESESTSISKSKSESMSTSTSESESTSTSKSESESISTSKSESESTSISKSESGSVSTSTSIPVSTSTSTSDSTSTVPPKGQDMISMSDSTSTVPPKAKFVTKTATSVSTSATVTASNSANITLKKNTILPQTDRRSSIRVALSGAVLAITSGIILFLTKRNKED